jgi:SAM-dependent methyltransferase
VSAAFDPVVYKETTRKQWQDAAAANRRRFDERSVASTDPPGPTRRAAARDWPPAPAATSRTGLPSRIPAMSSMTSVAGPSQRSITSPQRSHAAQRAGEAGLGNVETAVLDGEQLDVQEASFDAVISRVGFIYFPDQQAALRGMWRALKPGGKLAGIVYSTAEANGFFSVPVSIIRRRAQLPPPAPGQPGPFSLGEPGVIESAYERAGLGAVETRRMAAPLRLASAAECVRFQQESFGALHQMLAGLSDEGRADAWVEIEQALGRFERGGGFEAPCELLVAAGTR